MNNGFDHKPVRIKTHFCLLSGLFCRLANTVNRPSLIPSKKTEWRNARLMLVMQVVDRKPAWDTLSSVGLIPITEKHAVGTRRL